MLCNAYQRNNRHSRWLRRHTCLSLVLRRRPFLSLNHLMLSRRMVLSWFIWGMTYNLLLSLICTEKKRNFNETKKIPIVSVVGDGPFVHVFVDFWTRPIEQGVIRLRCSSFSLEWASYLNTWLGNTHLSSKCFTQFDIGILIMNEDTIQLLNIGLREDSPLTTATTLWWN